MVFLRLNKIFSNVTSDDFDDGSWESHNAPALENEIDFLSLVTAYLRLNIILKFQDIPI